MSVWLRYTAWIALILATPLAAHAQSATQRAAKLNDEGKDLWLKKNDLERAVPKFREAVQLDPQARYYFNLCYALHQLGRFREALPECRGAQSGGDEKVSQKAQVVIEDIEKRLAEEAPIQPPDGTDPSDTGGDTDPGDDTTIQTGTDPGADGQYAAPVPGLYQPAELPDDYKWSAGAALGLMGTNLGKDIFAGTGGSLKLFANFMLLAESRIGGQGYITISPIDGRAEFGGEPLTVVDLGAALYKHITLPMFELTPLAAVQVTGLDSALFADPLTAFGIRLEAAASWLFGPERQHVISVIPALSLYGPMTNSYQDAEFYGLNRSSFALTLSVGYSLRFTTPFGQTSLITLE